MQPGDLDSLNRKADAIMEYVIKHRANPKSENMERAAAVARRLASTNPLTVRVTAGGTFLMARKWELRVYVGDMEEPAAKYPTDGKVKRATWDRPLKVANWTPGTEIRIEAEEFRLINEKVAELEATDLLSIRTLAKNSLIARARRLRRRVCRGRPVPRDHGDRRFRSRRLEAARALCLPRREMVDAGDFPKAVFGKPDGASAYQVIAQDPEFERAEIAAAFEKICTSFEWRPLPAGTTHPPCYGILSTGEAILIARYADAGRDANGRPHALHIECVVVEVGKLELAWRSLAGNLPVPRVGGDGLQIFGDKTTYFSNVG